VAKPKHDERRQAAVLAAIQAFRRTFSEFNRRLAAAGDSGLSMADTMALHFVAHAGPVTAGDLARFTGLTSGAVTSMVDRLEQTGYLTRQRAQDDRRVVRIQLKPGARQKLMASMLAAHDEIGAMFDGWSADDIEDLVAHLERLQLD
jgi:MarR family transcriptional regulator, organic hydroperoxide resistance regulator